MVVRRLLATVAAVAALGAGPAFAAKDTAVIGMQLEPPTLDPTAGAAAAIDEVTYANLFESLTRINEKGEVIPGLATSWTVSDDGLVYTFTLREGVTYQDGTPFDSADVKFSLERAKAPDSTNAQKGFFEPIASVETPDAKTVVVTLSHPDGLFLFNMGSGDATIVAPESAATNGTKPIGTGPFKFGEWVAGDHVTLVRNPDYVGPDQPKLNQVTFRFIADPAAEVAAVLSGDIDAFPTIGAPESLDQFKSDPRFVVEVGTTEGETVMGLNERRKPFDDIRVRRALAYAIDRQAVIDGAMYGYGTPIGSHFAPHNPAYVDLTGAYPYDPEKAKALLAEAGYPDGFSTTFTLPPPAYARRGGEIIQAYLAEVGVKVELIPVEWAQWIEQTFTGYDYDMTIVSHTEPLDIGIYARGLDYYFGYQSDAFNAIIDQLNATTDPAARSALYGEAQRKLSEDEPAVFLFQLAKTGVRAAGLQGLWVNNPIQANDVTAAYWAE
jgi:peptide/nickel transport system substrate-binding protein